MTPTRALNSASNLHRRQLCPGSAAAEDGLPEESNDASAEGTLLHHHDASPDLSRDSLTQKQRDILDRNAGLRERFLAVKRDELQLHDETPVVFKEREFFLCDEELIPIEPAFPAHPDLILWYRKAKTAFIFDSKFGRNPVQSADVNLQLRTYGVVFNDECPCDRIYVAITQPWVAAPDDFHAAQYCGADMPHFKKELLGIIADTRKPFAPRRASVEACQWCKAKASCPEAAKIIYELAVAKVNGIAIPQLEKLWPEAKRARLVIDNMEERLKKIAKEHPDALQTLRLGGGGTTRRLDAQRAFDALAAVEGEAQAIALLLAASEVSLGKLASALAQGKGMKEDEAERWLESTLGEAISRAPREPQLVKK